MVQRIAEGMRDSRGPRLEFLERLGVSGDKPLGHAISPHGAPFVVIAFEPNLEQVVEPAIFCQVARRQVAMVIKNGLLFSELMIKASGGSCLQQKIFVNEF